MENDFDVMFILLDTLYYYFDKYLFHYETSFNKIQKENEIELGNLYTIYEEDEDVSLSITLLDNIVDDFLLV